MTYSLVGKYYHTNCEKQYQGKVIAELPSGQIVVQLFSWLDGSPTASKIVDVNDAVGWDFYSTHDGWMDAGDKIANKLIGVSQEGKRVANKNDFSVFLKYPESVFLNGESGSTFYTAISAIQAHECLQSTLWDKQRPANEDKVRLYADMMSGGEWVPGGDVRFTLKDGTLSLVNGQHRMLAMVKSGTNQTYNILVQKVSSDDEIARIFSSIDRGKSRTPYDMLHAVGIDKMHGWGSTEVNVIASAVKFIATDFTGSRIDSLITPRILESLIEKYAPSYDTWRSICVGLPRYMQPQKNRRALVSVALVTMNQSSLRYGMDKVIDFWKGLLFDDGLSIGDARKTANRHITSTAMPNSVRRIGVQVATTTYTCRYVANCFNAHMEGRTITKTVAAANTPIKILGSQYDGEKVRVEPILWSDK